MQMLPPKVTCPVLKAKKGDKTRTNGGEEGYSPGNITSSVIGSSDTPRLLAAATKSECSGVFPNKMGASAMRHVKISHSLGSVKVSEPLGNALFPIS